MNNLCVSFFKFSNPKKEIFTIQFMNQFHDHSNSILKQNFCHIAKLNLFIFMNRCNFIQCFVWFMKALVKVLPQWSQLNSKFFHEQFLCTLSNSILYQNFCHIDHNWISFFMNSCNMFLQSNILYEIFAHSSQLYFSNPLWTFSIMHFKFFLIISFYKFYIWIL